MERFVNLCVVCAGSALGGGARYLVYLLAVARGWTAFPWATLIVNVAGCFFIMVVATVAASTTLSTNLRLFLTTGIMGGLTTYSTFDFETTQYIHSGRAPMAALYVAVTLVACFGAGLIGRAIVD